MTDLLVLTDFVTDLLERPREATLFGQLGFLSQEDGKDYDFFYCLCEGVGHEPGSIDAKFHPLPVFLWAGESEDAFCLRLHEYAKDHMNKYAGVLGPDTFGCYRIRNTQIGTEVDRMTIYKHVRRAVLLDYMCQEPGCESFGDDLAASTAEIQNSWAASRRLATK